jgi:hypothetical protein
MRRLAGLWLPWMLFLSSCGTGGGSGGGTGGGSGLSISYKPCASTNECLSGETCFLNFNNGLCTRACVGDSDCGGDYCDDLGPKNACVKRCTIDSNCRSDFSCVARSATAKVCGSDPCSRISPCPNDVRSTATEIAACRTKSQPNQTAACFTLVTNLDSCLGGSVVCDSSGRTDGIATLTACKTKIDAAEACCKANPTSTACN